MFKKMPDPPQMSPLPPHPLMSAQSLRFSGPGSAPTQTPVPTTFQTPAKRESGHSSKEHSKPAKFTLPKLLMEIRDLKHAGAQTFLTSVIASKALETSVQSVLSLLYGSSDSTLTTVPGTRSVTLILRSMPGVAYTTGSDLDSDHKEIHLSLEYIEGIAESRKRDEIMGVLTHEMVHCYQYNAFGTCPGGLIEGIADWVRLNANLSPPHWKKEATGNWDAGYQHTGYFLEYLEQRYGRGTVRKLNEKLRIVRYDEKRFWTEICGRPVEQLWGDYSEAIGKGSAIEDEGVLIEKEDAATPTISKDSSRPALKK